MPVYEFKCEMCGERVELKLPVDRAGEVQLCPKCGSVLKRVFSLGGIRFVGKGFHVNDYPKR